MNTQQPPEPWLTVDNAAALVGKSVSTIRRLLPQVEREEPAAIRREPIEGKGGEKVLLSRSWLLSRFDLKEPAGAGGQEPQGAAAVVEILERQLEAKDKQINALQREAEAKSRQLEEAQRAAGELVEKLGQFAALNATLSQKIMQLSERAGATQGGAAPGAGAGADLRPGAAIAEPWLWVAVAVLLSLCGGLVLWLVFG